MPRTTRTYDHTTGYYRLSCLTPGCVATCLTGSAANATRESLDVSTGRPVHATFRYLGEGRGNAARCRNCERERRQGRRNAPASVPGMTRAADADTRRFGVELELSFPSGIGRSTIDAALSRAGLSGWRAKTDVSIRGNGWEIVSPVLQGENGREQVRTACRVLSELGAKANVSCGLHVHHDIRDLTVEGLKAAALAYHAHQSMIDGLVAPSRRGHGHTYIGPFRSSELDMIRACRTIEEFRTAARRISKYRNFGVNSYTRHNTLELRQHQGTVSAEKVLSWVAFGQALIQAAAEQPTATAVPQSRVRDMLALFGERLAETPRTFLLGRAVEFGAVQA